MMQHYQIHVKHDSRGFALLLAILVSVIILTIGLTILNTTLKQQILADVAQESERAFHAAYAGVECAQHWNIADVWDVGTNTTSIRCIDQVVTTSDVCSDPAPGASSCEGGAHEVKDVQFDWQSAGSADGGYTYDMCTQMRVYKYIDPSAATNMEALPIDDPSPLYDPASLKTCNIGVECTVVQSRGYNRPCGSLSDIRTVEREVTVRF